MSAGVASIGMFPKAQTVPPFPATAADNGLSVDPVTKKIVWGNDAGGSAAALLSNREVPMQTFSFSMLDNLNGLQFLVDPTIGAGRWGLGDLDNDAGGTALSMQDAGSIAVIRGNLLAANPAAIGLSLDFANDIYQIGDISNFGRSMRVRVRDNAGLGAVEIGDVDGINSGAIVQAVGATGTTYGQVNITTNSDLRAGIALRYQQQNDLGIAVRFLFQDSQVGGGSYFLIDAMNLDFQLGDLGITGNGNFFEIEDVSNKFRFANAALNAVININGTDGFTGTVTPVTSITVIGGIVTAVT